VARFIAILSVLLLAVLLGGSFVRITEPEQQVRAFTRGIEFDFLSWTVDAAVLKIEQTVLGVDGYIAKPSRGRLVRDYMQLVRDIQSKEGQLSILHADPDSEGTLAQIETLQAELKELYTLRSHLGPLAENVLQDQVTSVLLKEGLTSGGQPLPPLLFHSTPLPWALIVSPRFAIAQLANISLETELTLEEHIALEDEVEGRLGVSTLVVPVGGVGTYPTMVAQTSSLTWLCEVISHEWTHNYLTWHPLGALYFESPELTTMNETTANIVGKEVGAAVIRQYYADLAPVPVLVAPPPAESATQSAAPAFDYRAEMHTTRLHVDELLAAGQVFEAEQYMEERRLFFWDHGYAIRKLNQAYFAFYGSYADTPTGPAGADPVGAAVRELRARSASLKEFVDRMAGLTSFAELQELLARLP
jgi:hypothetical protein